MVFRSSLEVYILFCTNTNLTYILLITSIDFFTAFPLSVEWTILIVIQLDPLHRTSFYNLVMI